MKRLIKLMSIALCMLMVLSAALASVFALSMNGVSLASTATDNDNTESADTKAALFKDESVYVIANADGTVEKIIVSDWIRNNAKADTVTDFAKLDKIENVKGEETFTMNADNMRVWEAKGKDLYLKGEGTEPLPVDMRLTYFLDGAPIDPADLIGKSGDVTIRFDYTNNQYEAVEIDGKKENIYVPFMMLSGLMLDNEKFSDISVTNGKIISDGDRTIVAGIAFPGLQQDLGVKQKDIQIPDYFEVKAHTEDFELNSTVTIATNGLLNQLDTKDFDKLSDVKKDIKKLQDAMTQLTDGSSKLYDGLSTLLEKSSELTEGIEKLSAGAQQLSDGAKAVDEGASKLSEGAGQLKVGAIRLSGGASDLDAGSVQLDDGAAQLSDGLSQLTQNNAALNAGSDQTFRSILATARKALVDQGLDVPELTPENYAEVLDGLMKKLSEDNVKAQAEAVARQKVTAAVEANREAVTAGVTEAVRQSVEAEVEPAVRAQVTEAVIASLGYTVEDYNAAVGAGLIDEATRAQVSGAIDAKMASDEIRTTMAGLVEQNMQSEQVQAAIARNTEAQINSLIEQNMQSDEVQGGIAEAVAKAAAGVKSIRALKDQLDSYNKFNTGLKTYTDGVQSASGGADDLKDGTSQLKTGAGQLSGGAAQLEIGAIQLSDGTSDLKDGTKQLSDGSKELLNGILTLKNGVPALVDGVRQLKDGAMQLSDGLKQFDKEGISKIVSLLDNDLSKLAARLKAAVDVSKNYRSYTGLTDGMDGEVKFIYKTADLMKDEK